MQPTGTSPCPNWCISLHLDGDTLHHGETLALQLTRRPTQGERRFRPDLPAMPITLELVTHQDAGETTPWIAVLHEGTPVLDLAAGSASSLGDALQGFAADTAI